MTTTDTTIPSPELQLQDPVLSRAVFERVLGGLVKSVSISIDQVVVDVTAEHYVAVMQRLQNDPECRFEILVDLCGVDFSEYADGVWEGPRFAAITQLLSVSLNQRVRVRVFAVDDDFPVLPSLMGIWKAANWFEREAFDLFGIMFEGHDDLRRILTDYGFIGHPFRKDFPLSGHVEMRYDEQQKRVLYQPVTIEPREITPRIIREDNYGGLH